jgi:hypothetical protein
MKSIRKQPHQRLAVTAAGFFLLVLIQAPVSYALPYSETQSGDRAVEIAKQARDRVERNGGRLKASSNALFKEFAERTVALQKLIDTRERLDKSGFLAKGDPEGEARRAHINAKILTEVGELKKSTDRHLEGLLNSLQAFDDAVAGSLVDCQATRSINSNYELTLDQYLKQERGHFEQASRDAQDALNAYQDATDPRQKERLLKQYNRAKRRLIQIDQRRRLYEARIKVADMNQKISGLIREKIRAEGSDISSKFRQVMADLYNTFSKIVPIAEVGGTGTPEIFANLGFGNVEELRETLLIVDGAIGKLGVVLDDMVDDVLAGLGEIKVVKDSSLDSESLSIEEEMDFLSRQREAWSS